MVTFRQAIAFFFLSSLHAVTIFFCAASILLLAGTDLSSTQCHLEASIIISCAFQLHSNTCILFLQCQVSFPGAGVSVLLCVSVCASSPYFLCSLVGFLFRTAVFSVLALSLPKFPLLFIFLTAEGTLTVFLFLFLPLSVCIRGRDCFPPP